MRVVVDTNVIVSGLNFPDNERMVLELALRGRLELFLSRLIVEELTGVLPRKFGWEEERTAQAVSTLQNAATTIEPPRLAEVIAGGHAENRSRFDKLTMNGLEGLPSIIERPWRWR